MPAFDPLTYRYASRRNVVYAKNAVACTSVPLGAQIGLDVMKSGGNAVDAAVAMAAAMPLLEPTGNGLGSDCFALVWIERDKRLYESGTPVREIQKILNIGSSGTVYRLLRRNGIALKSEYKSE